VQNIFSSSLLSKNVKTKISRNIILPVVVYWSLSLGGGGLRVFENRVLRRIFGPKKDEVTGSGTNYIMRSLMCNSADQEE